MAQFSLINTGGTISSKTEGGVITAGAVTQFLGVTGVSPFSIHSENITAEHMLILSYAIKAAQHNTVVVTLGTDSLAHVAAFLAFENLDKTIILVSADKPLHGDSNTDLAATSLQHANQLMRGDNYLGNGEINLALANELIESGATSGVYVPYVNADNSGGVYFGARLLEVQHFSGALYSGGSLYAKYNIVDSKIKLDILNQPNYLPQQLTCCDCAHINNVELHFVSPDFSYNALAKSLKQSGNAAVLVGYHSGTVRAVGQDNATALSGLPVFIVGGTCGTVYQSHAALSGLNFVNNIAPLAFYYKLKKVIKTHGGINDVAKRQLQTNFSQEYFK